MRRASYCFAYYLSWVGFGLVGLALNLGCACLLPLPGRQRRAPGVRRMIRRLFEFWVRWFHACPVVDVRWVGFDHELAAGTVYIANHPSLVDATFLLARLPDAFCIFKPSLMRNPVIGPAAIMANYVAADNAVDLVRGAAERVEAGQSLLIFPEGTRTLPGTVLGRLKPGFELIARRAKAPVQLVIIRTSQGLVPKGLPWWRLPTVLPGWIELTLDKRWEPGELSETRDSLNVVEARMREVLTAKGP